MRSQPRHRCTFERTICGSTGSGETVGFLCIKSVQVQRRDSVRQFGRGLGPRWGAPELRPRVGGMWFPLAARGLLGTVGRFVLGPNLPGLMDRHVQGNLGMGCMLPWFLGWLPSCPALESRVVLVTSHQSVGSGSVSMAPSRRHRRSSHGTAAVISLPR